MRLEKHLSPGLTVFVATAALILAGAASANAALPNSSTADNGQTLERTVVNQSCLDQLRAVASRSESTISTDICTSTVVAQTSAARLVTIEDLASAKASLSESDYNSLAVAVAKSTVKAKSYSQTISQITDQERQYGTFYYDGTRAWVTTTYLGYKGTHFCVVDYAIGFSVTKQACTDSGSLIQRDLTMVWKFSLIVAGGPVTWGESYTLHVNRSGAIWQ